jgi:hypothetical protein
MGFRLKLRSNSFTEALWGIVDVYGKIIFYYTCHKWNANLKAIRPRCVHNQIKLTNNSPTRHVQ